MQFSTLVPSASQRNQVSLEKWLFLLHVVVYISMSLCFFSFFNFIQQILSFNIMFYLMLKSSQTLPVGFSYRKLCK